ncbi:MAG: hypothetical protein N2322_06915, partial [Terrimicrobiaceae bacterium]|nr:hypothetical protein [Terrimicrobiaceae bacterium]
GVAVRDGAVEARFGPGDETLSWQGELTPSPTVPLRTRSSDSWVEQWSLEVSPVWNVAFEGLPPVFDTQATDLRPLWRPWPGENATLTISRPEAIPGPTTTVRRVSHEVSTGKRQTTSSLRMSIEASLGSDLVVGLPEGAEVTSLTRGRDELPVRLTQGRLAVPLLPGEQDVAVEWRQPTEPGPVARVPAVELPLESSNISIEMRMPESRWVLWTSGPARGPAVRFWAVLALTLTAAWVLARARFVPLRMGAWVVLGLGLTQVHFLAAAVVAAWFLILGLKTREGWQRLPPWLYNLGQAALILLTLAAAAVLLSVVAAGLLGDPRMFIAGNDSSAAALRWSLDRSGPALPRPEAWSVSIWWYRLAMMAWALWLAFAVIKWAAWGWNQFTRGGAFRGPRPRVTARPQPPPLH